MIFDYKNLKYIGNGKKLQNYINKLCKINQVNEYNHSGYHTTFNSIDELENARKYIRKIYEKNNFWKEKKVLLTGIHGFIGSNLSKHLINNGAIVYGLTKNNSTYSLLSLERINNYNLINASGQPSDIFELINDKDIEICFHLGAQVEVQKAIQFPYDTLNNNINSTLQLCEAFRNSNHLKCFLFTSTDKVYGDIDKDKLPYKEDYTPLAKHPYEVSKLICENICKNYSENFKLPLIITRSCNLYGLVN